MRSTLNPGEALRKLGPLGGGAALLVLAAISWGNSSTVSFDPVFATIKLAIGLLHLVIIGAATRQLSNLARPSLLAAAHDALLGQVVCLGYVYARSFASSLLGLPGITTAEAIAAYALLLVLAMRKPESESVVEHDSIFNAMSSAAIHLLWLGWLFAIAALKLDLLYTPSSDPDIHAFYAKIFLEQGKIYYDLLPNSDAWMIYPSAFASMNFVLGRLSGLHPVQLVNIGVYFQLVLFAGATFSFIASLIERRFNSIALAVLHFGFCYFTFNAVFIERRMYLPGTPRLAHTALLLFPLIFAVQHRHALSNRFGLFVIPLVAILVGVCVNPSHAPAAVLVGALAFAAAYSFRNDDEVARVRMSVRAVQLAVVALITLAFLGSDPFYRHLVEQQLEPAEERELATDLTGGAFGESIDFAGLLPRALPSAFNGFRDASNSASKQPNDRLPMLAVMATAIVLLFVSTRRRGATPSSDEGTLIRFSTAALLALIVHAIWTEITPHLGQPDVLQTKLLVRYTRSLQGQLNSLFFSMAPSILVVLVLTTFSKWQASDSRAARWVPHAITLGSAALCLPLFYAAHEGSRSTHIDAMRRSSLGEVYASDVEFAEKVEARVGQDERVLLPGRSYRTRDEHWILTTHAGRALPLYSNVKTSFFLALDGWAYTAGAYQAHVEPPNFDPEWLREHKVLWLVESGNFPARILRVHYDRVFGNDHAVLWRLRGHSSPSSSPTSATFEVSKPESS